MGNERYRLRIAQLVEVTAVRPGRPEIGRVLDEHWARLAAQQRAQPGAAAALVAEDRMR